MCGAVVIGCGVFIFILSVEICIRLRKNMKRVKDPEIDKLKNLHQIKHWVHPGELYQFLIKFFLCVFWLAAWSGSYKQGPYKTAQIAAQRRQLRSAAEDNAAPQKMPPCRRAAVVDAAVQVKVPQYELRRRTTC